MNYAKHLWEALALQDEAGKQLREFQRMIDAGMMEPDCQDIERVICAAIDMYRLENQLDAQVLKMDVDVPDAWARWVRPGT